MANEKDIDYDDDPADFIEPKVEETVEKVERKDAPEAKPKHKPFFLRKAMAAGISADEAEEMEPDELERAIRLSSVERRPDPKPEPKVEKVEEDDDDEFAALKDQYDEELIKPISSSNKKLKAELKALNEKLAQLADRERKRDEAEFASKIDGILIKAGIPAVGDKPFTEYDKDAPEIEARKQIFAAASTARREGEAFESALKRTLKLFTLSKPDAKPEPKAEDKKPDSEVADKLAERRKQFSDGGVAKPMYQPDEPLGGRPAALKGIAGVINKSSRS